MLKLTDSNYHSIEANREYWSASQVKTFLDCPARAMAELSGWKQPASKALQIGSFVDAAFDGEDAFTSFIAENPDMFKRDGSLKADFAKAEQMVSRAEQDGVFMKFMDGEKQSIKTGFIDGIPFRIKMDVYLPGERIVDLKTVKDLKPLYRPGEGRLSFAEYWRWTLQMAIYQEIEGNRLPCFLAVITKEDPPGIQIVQIEQEKLDAELAFLKNKLPYFNAIKTGIIEPDRCEECAYCRESRKLTGPVMLDYYSDMEE